MRDIDQNDGRRSRETWVRVALRARTQSFPPLLGKRAGAPRRRAKVSAPRGIFFSALTGLGLYYSSRSAIGWQPHGRTPATGPGLQVALPGDTDPAAPLPGHGPRQPA